MSAQFWIGWTGPEQGAGDNLSRAGRIVAPPADLDDGFIAPLGVWSATRYAAQWRDGLKRITEEEMSTLVTRLLRGVGGSFGGERWLLYRQADSVVLRNQLVLRETVPAFDPERPYDSVPPRRTSGSVSEWKIPMRSVEEFLDRGDSFRAPSHR
jgi:hypothetical protein